MVQGEVKFSEYAAAYLERGEVHCLAHLLQTQECALCAHLIEVGQGAAGGRVGAGVREPVEEGTSTLARTNESLYRYC